MIATNQKLFETFFIGGFECSSHRLRTGERLDMIAATAHDKFALEDYRRLHDVNVRTARDGLRWHLIENSLGTYDFSSAHPLVSAAREVPTQVIWDLCHYGWPDHVDIFKPAFVDGLANFARAFAQFHRDETDQQLFVAPVNEISFFGWGGGQVGYLNPFARRRGDKLKLQLVRAAIAATEAVWDVDPRARIAQIDPVINVVAGRHASPENRAAAERESLFQYEAWDMLGGYSHPELGGAPKYLDVIGANYYPCNQWIRNGPMIDRADARYRPLSELLGELYRRYKRPVFVAETGVEDDARPEWLRYVGEEVRAALRAGTPVEGVCLYPIINHPGWDDKRHCHNGLWDYPDEQGGRVIYAPLAEELRAQQKALRDEPPPA